MIEAAARLRDATWGLPLVLLLAGAGLYLTILLRGLQLRGLGRAFRLAFLLRDEPGADGDLSHFQALMTALASGAGVGSLVGVPVALALGGPGALLWLWVAGCLAMAVRYAEAVLGVRFRETDVRGEKCGGPMQYLEAGIRWGGLGRTLALSFAGFTILAALGYGNGMQAHLVASSVAGLGGVPPLLVGGVTALAAGAVVLGGIRSIGRVAGILVPALLLAYLAVAAWALVLAASSLPDALRAIVDSAGGTRAAGGGVAGYTFAAVLRGGLAHGMLAGEAGLGTGAIAAATARTREPVRQALVAMTGTFIDTLVVGTVTGLVVLTATPGAGGSGPVVSAGPLGHGVATLRQAFGTALPGTGAAWFVGLALAAFAFTSLLAWAYYGERAVRYVAGERTVVPFRLLFVGLIPLGSVFEMELLWTLSDASRGLMALPNLVGLILLSGIVVRETRGWLARSNGSGLPGDQPSNRR